MLVSEEPTHSYEEAVSVLNTFQSNAAVLHKVREERDRNRHLNVPEMKSLCESIGVMSDDIDSLKVIHVAGTKGKGSTCAFVESILRQHGFTTGLYSSPHLVEVRERIRINGEPISRNCFSQQFFKLHNKLTIAGNMSPAPAYFKYLTLLAMQVFVDYKVDVAIVEVGIGGRFDSTNFIQHPWICAITSLGYDHLSILGDTLTQIAWNKAGIMKSGALSLTVDQPDECIPVLLKESNDVGCPLYKVPSLNTYNQFDLLKLGIGGNCQLINASMALQICFHWLRRYQSWLGNQLTNGVAVRSNLSDFLIAEKFDLTCEYVRGLSKTRWPGRCGIYVRDNVNFYVDAAHTVESMQLAVDWFNSQSHDNRCVSFIFNLTGDRSPLPMLQILSQIAVDNALFCPNVIEHDGNDPDHTNLLVATETIHNKVLENCQLYQTLLKPTNSTNCEHFPSLRDTLDYIYGQKDRQHRVFVVGSVHLVGCLLKIIDPKLSNDL